MQPSLKPRLLLVDSDPASAGASAAGLAEEAHDIAIAGSCSQALSHLRASPCDVVIADLRLSDGSALDLLAAMRAEKLDAGVVILSRTPDCKALARAVRLGASDFVLQPASPASLRLPVLHTFHATQVRRSHEQQFEEHVALLAEERARTRTLEQGLEQMQNAVMEAFLAALGARENDTLRHSLRIRAYALHLAQRLGYPACQQKHLEHAALLHDVGKIGLSDALLFHTGPYTASDLERMKPHAVLGEQILNSVDFLRPAALIVRHHHERYDGSGYPDKLTCRNIPLGSRILAIADTLDALTNPQIYRPAQTFEDAIEEIGRWAGKQFDPAVVEEFRRVPAATWRRLRSAAEASLAGAAPLRILDGHNFQLFENDVALVG